MHLAEEGRAELYKTVETPVNQCIPNLFVLLQDVQKFVDILTPPFLGRMLTDLDILKRGESRES